MRVRLTRPWFFGGELYSAGVADIPTLTAETKLPKGAALLADDEGTEEVVQAAPEPVALSQLNKQAEGMPLPAEGKKK